MPLETTYGAPDLLRVSNNLGILEQRKGSCADALSKYLRLHNLLRDDTGVNWHDRRRRRQEYIAEVRSFETQIRCIRFLKRVEMARSGSWDFTDYLKGAWTIIECRVILRIAYLAHAIHIRGASGLAEKAGFTAFNAIFFDRGGLPELAEG